MFTHLHLTVVRPIQAQEVSTFLGPSINLIEGPDEGSLFPHFLDLDSAEDVVVLHYAD